MDQDTLQVILSKFKDLSAEIKTYHERMDKHVEADLKVHAVVQRHATYWKFVFMGVPVVGGALAKKMGWV